MNTATRPIGVFDSGVGGLTVLSALHKRLPNESFVYLGDTARLPYGSKSTASVERYALQAARRLAGENIKYLVVACNTASAVALAALRRQLAVPVLGVVEPGAAAGCLASKSGRIAVIATEGTVRGGAYEAAIARRRSDASVVAQPCPLFVALAEEGLTSGSIVEAIAHRYLDELFAAGPARPDTLVLGCTHFPVLASALRKVVGDGVAIVDSAQTTAEALAAALTDQGLLSNVPAEKNFRFLATDGPERFARVGGIFLGAPLAARDIEIVDLGSVTT